MDLLPLRAKSMENGEFCPPMTSKSLNFFQIWTWHPWLRPGVLHQCKFSFQSVQRASPQIGEILRFCDFFLVTRLYCIFSRARAQVEPVDGFSRLTVHTTWFRQRTVLLGVATISEFIWGQHHPKTPPKGAWIGNLKPNQPNIKITISCKV